MTQIKLTKNALRDQQHKLKQLMRYLPTLKLKKTMLQVVVNDLKNEIEGHRKNYQLQKSSTEKEALLLTTSSLRTFYEALKAESVEKNYENIAGVDVATLKSVEFAKPSYDLLTTPIWAESMIMRLHDLATQKIALELLEKKKKLIEKELKEVNIRVNLFEKILIPRTEDNIKKIKVFLGDQQLAAVAQAKVAKGKILSKQQAQQEATI